MARSLGQIDAALAAQDQAPKGLAEAKPLDRTLELKQEMDSVEKVVCELKNVTLTALQAQSNDIGDPLTITKTIANTIEDKVGPVVQDHPVMRAAIEDLKQELSKQNARLTQIQTHAIGEATLSQVHASRRANQSHVGAAQQRHATIGKSTGGTIASRIRHLDDDLENKRAPSLEQYLQWR